MIRPQPFAQLAAHEISMPTFAVPSKLAKETVYMPSPVAARLLGGLRAPESSPAGRDSARTEPVRR